MVGKAGGGPVALEEEVVVGFLANVKLGHKAMLKASRRRLSASMVLINMCMRIVSSAQPDID